MTEAEQLNLMMKGFVTEMPAKDQEVVRQAAEELRAVVSKHGDCGTIAFSLVGAEMAAKP